MISVYDFTVHFYVEIDSDLFAYPFLNVASISDIAISISGFSRHLNIVFTIFSRSPLMKCVIVLWTTY